MPEAVSLGTVYSGVELRLDGFNKSWDFAIAKLKGLQEKLDSLKFDPAKITAGTDALDSGFAKLSESLSKASGALAKLSKAEFSAKGILQGADQAVNALGELSEKAGFTSQRILDLSAKSTEARGSLRGLGTAAQAAEKGVGSLAGTSDTAAAAVEAVGKAGQGTGAELETLADGAKVAKGSLSGLGRVAEATAGKLDTLSLAKFDPAGIILGADEGIGALERLRLAAQGVRTSLRMAPGMTGMGGTRGRNAGVALMHGGGMVANGAGNLAAGATVIAGIDLKNYVEYSGQAQQLAGNTNMSAADQERMYRSGLSAMRLGGDGEGAMKSYMHIANHSYSGQSAENINDMAVKMNVATGANTELSGQVVAALMHQMGLTGSKQNVSRVGNMIHQTTASGDLNLENYNKYAAPAVGKALALGNSPADSAAFITALTQNNIRVPQAATNLAGISWQVTHPTAKSQKAIDKAGLSEYYGAGKLHEYGLHDIIGKTFAAVGGDQNRLMDIFGNKQGGFGALVATSKKGASDYKSQLYDPKQGNLAALSGKLDPIGQRFGQMQKTPQQQVKRLQGEMKADSIEIGKSFVPLLTAAVPVLKMFADQVQRVAGFLGKLPLPVQEAVVGLGVMKLATVALGNPLIGLGEGVGGLVTKLAGLGEGATVLESLGALAGPLALVAAGVALLGLAWATDFGHIREVTAKVGAEVKAFVTSQFGYVVKWFHTNMPLIRETVKTALTFIEQFWHSHGSRIMAIITPLWSFIKTVFSAALHIIGAAVKLAMDVITGHWGAAAKDVGVIVTNLWAVVRSLFVNGGKAIGNALMLVIDTVLDFGKRLFEGMLNAGQQAINGIVGGIKGGIGRVTDAARSLAASVPSAVTSFLQIHSPSRVMHEIGRHTSQGLADGISAGKSNVTAAMRGVVEAALKETNHKKAVYLIDHEARALRAGGMSASDAADFRQSAKAQLPAGRSRADRTQDAGRGTLSGTGEAIAEAAFQKYSRGLSRAYQGLCEGLAHDTYQSVTGAYEKYMDGGKHNSALKTLRRFQHAGLAERYTPGTLLAPGSLLYSDKLGHGDGHVSTIGPHGERLDQHGVNAFAEANYDWFVPPPSAAKDERKASRAAKVAQAAAAHLARIQGKINETLAQIHDSLAAFKESPNTPSLDKQQTTAQAEYHRQIKGLGGDQFGPYTRVQQQGMSDAGTLLKDRLAGIQRQRDAATADVQAGIDQMTDKAAEDKHPYDFQRDQAKKKYGPEGTEIKAGADPVKTAEALRLALKAVDEEELKDTKQAEDRKQQYLLSTQAISLSQYQAYLKTRLGDYHEYSSEWVQISQSINDIDLQLWKQQEDALKQKFDAGLLDLKDYIAQMQALELALPKTAEPGVKAEVDDTIARAQGKDKKISDKEMVGGEGFWKDLTDGAAEGGSHFLTALLHRKNRKSIFQSMQTDLMSSLEGGLTKGFASMLKNLISGGLPKGGFNLGSLFGGLFGGSKKSQAADPASTMTGAGMVGTGMSAAMSLVPGLGGMGSLLSGSMGSLQGINGPVGGLGGASGGLLGGLLGHGGLAGLLGHGGLASMAHLLPWLGGGLLLNSALGNPLGKAWKGIKKLFHFASGTPSVPGSGNQDSVPAMLTPGEMVIPKAGAQVVREALNGHSSGPGDKSSAARVSGGDTHIHVAHYGDVNNLEDGHRFHEDLAWQIKQQLPVTTPGT